MEKKKLSSLLLQINIIYRGKLYENGWKPLKDKHKIFQKILF